MIMFQGKTRQYGIGAVREASMRVSALRSLVMAVVHRSGLTVDKSITEHSVIALACQNNKGQVSVLNSQVYVIFIESSELGMPAKKMQSSEFRIVNSL